MKNISHYNLAIDCVDKHANVLQNKHKTALVFFSEENPKPLKISYTSLQALTNRMANGFRSLGLKPEERILLRLSNTLEFPLSFLGAVKAGLIPIPTSPQLTFHELSFLIKDSGASALITSETLFPLKLLNSETFALKHFILSQPKPSDFLKEVQDQTSLPVHRWQDLLKNAAAHFQTESTRRDAPAFWLYTSGTEGEPKAVIHAHQSIPAHDARARDWQDVKMGDVIFNTSALNWSYALTGGFLDVLRHGLTSVIYQGELRPQTLSPILKTLGVTIFMSVPGIYKRWVQEPKLTREAFAKVRVCLSAGEKLAEATRQDFLNQTGLVIYEGLGMTEHSVYLIQPYGEPIPAEACGRPVSGQKISVLREDLSEAPVGEVGILATHRSCQGLMLGYHHRLKEQARVFQGEWFLSDDLAVRDEAGNIFFKGRRDDVITSGGYRISPLEVEGVLNQCEGVLETAVVEQEVAPGKHVVVAYWVMREDATISEDMLLEKLRRYAVQHLAAYKLPRDFFKVAALPKTENGKIRRKLLRRTGE